MANYSYGGFGHQTTPGYAQSPAPSSVTVQGHKVNPMGPQLHFKPKTAPPPEIVTVAPSFTSNRRMVAHAERNNVTRWYAVVVSTDTGVCTVEIQDENIQVPLETATPSDGDTVIVEFGDGGAAAVVAVLGGF